MPIIIPILIAAILAGGGVTAVQAQDSLPGQTLYPVKMATEKIQLAFSNQEGDVKLHTKFASKRIQEIEKLVSQTQGAEAVEIKTEFIEETTLKLKQEVELSEKGLAALAEKGKDVAELALRVEEATNNHLEILAGLVAKVPMQAQPALEKAREVSQKGQITALEAIIQAGEKGYAPAIKPLVQSRVQNRLEQAKAKTEIIKGEIGAVPGKPTDVKVQLETKIKQVDESIQKSEELLGKQGVPQAWAEIKKINFILNELDADTTLHPDWQSETLEGTGKVSPTDQQAEEPDSPANLKMTLNQAIKIALANQECVEYGLDTSSGSYNSNSQTWWFNLTHKTQVCDYACVVYELKQKAEIYPMCRGLIVPDKETSAN